MHQAGHACFYYLEHLVVVLAPGGGSDPVIGHLVFFFILLFHMVLTHSTILDHLFKLQMKDIRVISFKDRYAHTAPLFYMLKLLKLHDIHSLVLLSFVFECQSNQPMQPFNKFFTPLHSFHNYNTRGYLWTRHEHYSIWKKINSIHWINFMKQFGLSTGCPKKCLEF